VPKETAGVSIEHLLKRKARGPRATTQPRENKTRKNDGTRIRPKQHKASLVYRKLPSQTSAKGKSLEGLAETFAQKR